MVEVEKENVQLRFSNVIPIIKKNWFVCLNIMMVFYFEYAILTSFADVLNRQSKLPDNPTFFQVHAYQILSFLYQLGVVLSRSSLYLFDIKRWGVLTILQMLNFAGWFAFAFFTLEVFVQFAWMLFVGLIGGFSYVNIYYDVLENTSKKLE